jgi:hypothetical protein
MNIYETAKNLAKGVQKTLESKFAGKAVDATVKVYETVKEAVKAVEAVDKQAQEKTDNEETPSVTPIPSDKKFEIAFAIVSIILNFFKIDMSGEKIKTAINALITLYNAVGLFLHKKKTT